MKLTNKYNLPQAIVDVIESLNYDKSKSDSAKVGVTSLIGPPIIELLKRRHWNELEEDVADHLWRIGGQAHHYILEKAKSPDRLVEHSLETDLAGITVRGRLDLYEKLTGSIEDWKWTSMWTAKNPEGKGYEEQCNTYACILRKQGEDPKQAYVNILPRDWRRGELARYTDYPAKPFVRIKITLWTPDEAEVYLIKRVALWKDCIDLPDDKLPICTEEERWYKPGKWAVYKGKNKSATRLLDTETEAKAYIEKHLKDSPTRIEYRPGVNGRCSEYCIVQKFCPFGKKILDGTWKDTPRNPNDGLPF